MNNSLNHFSKAAALCCSQPFYLHSSGCAMLGGGKFGEGSLLSKMGWNKKSEIYQPPASLSLSQLRDSDDIPEYRGSSTRNQSSQLSRTQAQSPNQHFTSSKSAAVIPAAATMNSGMTEYPSRTIQAPQRRQAQAQLPMGKRCKSHIFSHPFIWRSRELLRQPLTCTVRANK